MNQLLQPRHHHYLLGAVVAVSAASILIAGSPYLLAQSNPAPAIPDTSLTAPAPNTIVPPLNATPIEPIDLAQPPQALPAFPPLPPEVLKALPPEILKQLAPGTSSFGSPFSNNQPIAGNRDNGMMEDRIDPREIQMIMREVAQLRRELKRLNRSFANSANAVDEQKQITALMQQLDEVSAALKSSTTADIEVMREAIDSFRDANMHEQLGMLRAKVELPKQLKKLEQELKRVQKLSTQAAFQKLGFDLTKLTVKLEELRQGYNAALEQLKQGDLEDAMESIRDLELDGHPGEAVEVMYRLRDLQRFLKQVKDKDVKAEADAIVKPIIEAFNQGEFDQARELMGDAFMQLTQLSQVALRLERGRTGNRADMMKKLGDLEEKLQQKYEALSERESEEAKLRRPAVPTIPVPPTTSTVPQTTE